jgi:hypothetical protein
MPTDTKPQTRRKKRYRQIKANMELKLEEGSRTLSLDMHVNDSK